MPLPETPEPPTPITEMRNVENCEGAITRSHFLYMHTFS